MAFWLRISGSGFGFCSGSPLAFTLYLWLQFFGSAYVSGSLTLPLALILTLVLLLFGSLDLQVSASLALAIVLS